MGDDHEAGEQHIAVGNPNLSVEDIVAHTEGYGAEEPPVGTHDATGVVDDMGLLTDEQLAEGASVATEQNLMMEVDIIAANKRSEHSTSAAVINISTSPLADFNASSKMNVETVTEIPNPTFSLGLTQEDPHPIRTYPPVGDNCDLATNDDVPSNAAEHDDVAPPYRKSKRAKVVPRALVGDYQCDKRVLTRAWEAHVAAISSIPNNDYAAKRYSLSEKLNDSFVINVFGLSLESRELSLIVDRSTHLPAKVVDVLIRHTRSVLLTHPDQLQSKNSVFLETKFVSLLSKTFTRFSKAPKKENFRFPTSLSDILVGDCEIHEASRFYFPFNFDKKHWVGICIDCSNWQVIVLDCNYSLRTDGMISKELPPIAQMFPFLLRQAGKQIAAKDLKTLTVERPRSVPQNYSQFDSGITASLLIQAHAVGGVDVCKCITEHVLDAEVERTAVMIYEDNVGLL
ncbi:PREDICTED: uncharacterized protein LOC106342564 [Brassica oleracea var. oleracea]|uniref:uncharacterized protein LOC106342564 n=1 Tax=Brassica oleracea var. oleracea TaxID=109376 RepID=UPI0006A70392|nr:PREDICTED: uncharacterized protein LOC106342564 [Brassica oleracea var. oleracea]